ncbi:MAG: Holliday junction branch migration DNA helicase RuvB [Acidobacteria bacterium]|nr:Holliday junction branch migration DNA helicase RuvB [Acidobacteriota bacterium]NIM60107.1 Holliday junction branch migration DNA helicase RuvB [Acidobacteriota bacterium]NIO59465.1 Holliday junction branch migration DNA helicase RuvB [Acidobacteriota bacterium]NIQ30496.1 Holliday junction branch migration DNA helicase RuvB [Acidobacteriota bacterium]NIQ85435.1 Holliday junction branch migration DNA helicase RuvB [Acidobacteriota bacterium]
MESDRIVDREAVDGEQNFEQTLRPRVLGEFVGQRRIKDNLAVFIEAATQRGEPLDHVLLYGPPGLGKTTLAHVIGQEMDAPVRISSGPSIEKSGDLAAILSTLEGGEILFLDEIHRLGRALEEILYPAMEDRSLDLVIGSGPGARTVRLDLPPFTLVGATTRFGLLSPPLRDRFGIIHHLDYYDTEELTRIAARSAGILKIELSPSGAEEIARRSRGTPRIANRLLRRVRDFAQVAGEKAITAEVAAGALERLEVDRYGLDQVDRRMLKSILTKFDGGPVGLATLAATVGEDAGTIEEIYEPYLLQIGFLDRTPRGRRTTRLAHEHLRSGPPEGSLF